ARKRAEEEGRGATGPAHDLRDREAETERKRELVSHSGKNGGERGGAGVKQAGAALFGSAKEQKVAVTEKSRAIEQAIQQIEKQFGKGSIMKLGGAGEKIDAISTGSLAVDLALGVGGFPRGRGVANVGLQARLMSQALRKLTGTISKTKTTVIFINQLREKIGIMFGNPETTSGGRALKFYASIRIDIRPIEPIKQGDVVIGRRVKVKVVKNKVAPPFRIAEIEILANEGISREGGLLDMGLATAILDKSGAWINYGKQRIGQGRENAKQFLREHQDVAAQIEAKVRDRSLNVGAESPNGEES